MAYTRWVARGGKKGRSFNRRRKGAIEKRRWGIAHTKATERVKRCLEGPSLLGIGEKKRTEGDEGASP